MEIRVLRYFLEVAREGNITHAAKRLHVSQPTLSKQLKDLELELGTKLFTRSSFRIHLTQEGIFLRQRAEAILEMVDKTTKDFQNAKEVIAGDIHIGVAESENIQYLAKHIKAIQEEYPAIHFHLCSGDTQDLADRLDQGLFDFAVIAQAVDLSKYNYLEFPGSDTWGVIMRKDDVLAQKEKIFVDDLLDQPLIVSRQGINDDLPKIFQEKVDNLNIVATYNLAYNAGILVKVGLGYALSFDRLVDTSEKSPLCFRPFHPSLKTKLFLIWKKYPTFTSAAKVFLNHLQENPSLEKLIFTKG